MKESWAKLKFWLAVLSDRQTPFFAKCIAAAGLLYLVFPLDLIIDHIPIWGWLDDLAIIGLLGAVALRFVPSAVKKRVAARVYGRRGQF